jgi:hypothetical protein
MVLLPIVRSTAPASKVLIEWIPASDLLKEPFSRNFRQISLLEMLCVHSPTEFI